jgi:hypothetical protein
VDCLPLSALSFQLANETAESRGLIALASAERSAR